MHICVCMSLQANCRKITKRLRAEGWALRGAKGSHQFEKDELRLTVVHPCKDITIGTARAIARAAVRICAERRSMTGSTT